MKAEKQTTNYNTNLQNVSNQDFGNVVLVNPLLDELSATARPDLDKCFPAGNGHRAGQEDCFLNPFMHRRIAVAHSEPTKAFPKLSPETALSRPFC